MKQVGPAVGTMKSSTIASSPGERSQLVGEVSPIVVATEVTPNPPSSILAKRKRDDAAGSSGHKKSKAFMSLRALGQVAGLLPTVGCLSIMQDWLHRLLLVLLLLLFLNFLSRVQFRRLLLLLLKLLCQPLRLILLWHRRPLLRHLLLSAGVVGTSPPTVLPPSSTVMMASPSVVLAAMASPSLSSHPRV